MEDEKEERKQEILRFPLFHFGHGILKTAIMVKRKQIARNYFPKLEIDMCLFSRMIFKQEKYSQ